MKTLKLAFRLLLERPARLAFTTLATAAAVGLVIWISSGYEALEKTYDEYSNLALGRYELTVAPIQLDEGVYVSEKVLAELRKDPSVRDADPMDSLRLAIRIDPKLNERGANAGNREDSSGKSAAGLSPASGANGVESLRSPQGPDGPGSGPNARLPSLRFIATDASLPPFDLSAGVWFERESLETLSVVLRKDVAEGRGLAVGDYLSVEFAQPNAEGDTEVLLQVIGLLDAPSLSGAEAVGIPMLVPGSGEAFVTAATLEKMTGQAAQIRLLGIALDPNTDITKFRFGWAPRLNAFATPVQFQEAFEIEEALDQAAAAQNVRMQSYAATGIAMVVAMLVIFCSLSMGVTERIRQFAILRAICMTRFQIGFLITFEGMALGVVGLFVGVGIAWLVLRAIAATYDQMLYHGIGLGVWTLTLACLAALGGAALASLFPIYRAVRVKPLDAMIPIQSSAIHQSLSWWWTIVGLLLIAVNPLLTFVLPPSEERVYLSMAIGFGSMTVGFILIAPLVVVLVDLGLSPLLTRLFGVDPKLLASQISNNLWRTVGASIAMAFGLGLFVGIQVWGFTMLEAFIPGNWSPDAIAVMEPGLPKHVAARIASVDGVDADRCLPLVVEQPRLIDDITGSAQRPSVTRQDNVVIVGLDPRAALLAPNSLLEFDWVAGSREEAVMQMQQGHACVVPDHFLEETGLSVGDSIALAPPRNSAHPAIYRIAGAVRLPGWHWQTKLTGLRPRTHRAAALVFADYESVAEDFDLPVASHVWFSYADSIERSERSTTQIKEMVTQLLEQEMRRRSGGLSAADADTLRPQDPSVRVVAVQGIRDHLQGAARRWIWVISQVPLISLVIACLGLLNVMLASVRARRWEFGVLRSIGFTSSDLTRAIFLEGLLIAIVAALLSVGFGLLGGWCGSAMAQYISFFGGLHPPMVIPWLPIIAGVCLVLTLGLFTAAWPAISIGRTRPMRLLQQGRDFV
ncbi:Macrolide export ATP-binding/permease protein MacB [Roseimaritima multifibrata]|uniref:Macrolide export ATP-binding/permease protein MacB n=1 Tax=Roseimaritima multifibrata TaxID=1930274 RepID=A0A517MIT4_9BACT|nr:ABC transporter permease [Roseimaritima multifibrata]QDS94758.1 Macrolide export ATP-binding/permease protein MacB [Roseimaritima multifibrata]